MPQIQEPQHTHAHEEHVLSPISLVEDSYYNITPFLQNLEDRYGEAAHQC